MPKKPRFSRGQAAFVFIFITVVLDMLALGVMVPVLPKLIVQFKGGDVARAAAVSGIFGFAWAAMQFIFSPVLGTLSDRFGRRPVVLLSNFGLGLDYVFMAMAPSLGWLFVGRVISGITSSSFPTACAYISDVTAPEKRAARFGMLSAAFGLGFIIGPAVGGFLGGIDLRLPFWVAAGLSLVNAVYGFFILPESLSAEKREKFHWKVANPLGALKLLKAHPALFGLSVVMFLYFLAHEALPSVFVLYADHRYGWGQSTVGSVLAIVGVCSMLVSATLVGPLVKKLGERWALFAGLTCGALGFMVYGLAPKGWIFIIGIPIVAFWGLIGPSAQALMSRHSSPAQQGRLQGALASIRGVTGMIGPLLFTQVFAAAIGPFSYLGYPGAPYLLGGSLLVLSLGVATRVTRLA